MKRYDPTQTDAFMGPRDDGEWVQYDEAAEIEKGEDFEWQTEDRNTFVLRRVIKAKPFVAKKKKC